jgi:DNA-binding FadR family transcriptional regulator
MMNAAPMSRMRTRRTSFSDRVIDALGREIGAGVLPPGAPLPVDLAFHAAVLAACHNAFLRQLGGALSEILRTTFSISSRDLWDRALSLALHEAVLSGIERHDEDAAEAAILRLIGLAGEMLERMAGRVVDPAG